MQIGERLKLSRDPGHVTDNFNAEYTCQARTNVFEAVSRRVAIVSEGVPTFIGDFVYYAEQSQNQDEASHVYIDFAVLSNPPYQVCRHFSLLLPIKRLLSIQLR